MTAANGYETADAGEEMGVVADAALAAANRAAESIDDMLVFVAASNKRIVAMETKARKAGRAA